MKQMIRSVIDKFGSTTWARPDPTRQSPLGPCGSPTKSADFVRSGPSSGIKLLSYHEGGSVAEWLACWIRAQKGPGSNRSREAVG